MQAQFSFKFVTYSPTKRLTNLIQQNSIILEVNFDIQYLSNRNISDSELLESFLETNTLGSFPWNFRTLAIIFLILLLYFLSLLYRSLAVLKRFSY